MLASTCALHHNCVHFFVEHLKHQKCSEHDVFGADLEMPFAIVAATEASNLIYQMAPHLVFDPLEPLKSMHSASFIPDRTP